MRINNLEFREASYLGEKPNHPSYHIDKWEPNIYYKKQKEYIKDGDYYKNPEFQYYRIHKNCFKSREVCYAIASFYWDSKEECYNFEFIGDRPLYLTEDEKVTFWHLIQHGFTKLNGHDEIC